MSCHPEFRRGLSARGSHGRGLSPLATSSAVALCLAAVQPVAAQTVNVNAPGSLTAATGTTAPANGAVWNLNSAGIFLNTGVTLPAGTPGLTINGNGNTLTLNNGAAPFGSFLSSAAATAALSNLTISGGSIAGDGGAISAGGALTLNTTGAVAFTNNSATGFGSGGAIDAFGGVSIGNAGSTVTFTGNTASSIGGGGAINGNANVTLNGSTIAMTSNSSGSGGGGAIDAIGAVSIGDASSTVALTSNTSVGTGGAIFGHGAVTLDGSAITLSDNRAGSTTVNAGGGAIFAGGDVSIGNSNSTIMLVGNTATFGGGAIDSNSAVTLNGSAITVTGNSTTQTNGGAIFASNFTLNATGPAQFSGNAANTSGGIAGFGGAIWVRGNVTLNALGGDVIFSGNTENLTGTPRANAIYLGNTISPATATFNAAAGRSITFFDPIQSNAFIGLVTVIKTGAGTVAFDGSLYANPTDRLSQVYANTTVQQGSFVVDNNAVYGSLAADVSQTTPSSFTVDSVATLAGGIADEVRANNFALNGTLNVAGAAPPGNASGGFSTFTVTSNNVSFGAGSQVLFNTYLNDASVQRTDLLVLNLNGSTTSGTASIFVTNVGGPGGLTETGNGIQLVQVNSGAAPDAFTLANPELRAGAYDYRLFRGGDQLCQPNNETTVCESWYLRSTFVEEPPPQPPVTPPNVLPPEPPASGPGEFPIIGPEIATYGVVQPMAQQLGRTMLGTHDDRLGDLYPVPCEPVAPVYTKAPPLYTKARTTDCVDGWRPAVWGRVFGQQIDNHYQAYADPRTDGQIAGLQVGLDVVRSDSLIPGHKDYGGFYFAYGNANADVTGLVTNAAATAYVLQHTGALNLNAYSGGAYWTHYGVPGWYVDLTLQGTSFNGGASTEFASLKTTGSGFISSLEGGYPIALPQLGFGFVLEPQAQVLWQYVSFDSGNDGLGPVALGTSSETTVRLGLKGKWTIVSDSGQVWQPYVRTNVWSDFGPVSTTFFGSDSTLLISRGQYMDVDAGFTTKIDTHFSGFAEAGYQFAISNDGGGKRDGVKGTAGLRYQW